MDTDKANPDRVAAGQVVFGGATSRRVKSAYYLVPTEGEERVALRFGIGAELYGRNNWQNGDAEFILERISHMQEHMRLFRRDGNRTDDNLGAILWAGYCLSWYEANRPAEWAKALQIVHGGNKK